MRISAAALSLLSLVGLVACCDVQNGEIVIQNQLLGSWYEIESYGDAMTATFCKCIKNDISFGANSGKIEKTRSYKLKFFPFITFHETSRLVNQGTQWAMETSSFLGKSSVGMSVLQVGKNYIILKVCPHAWFTDERIWVYAKNTDLAVEDIAAINKTLKDKAEPSFSSFRTISQSC